MATPSITTDSGTLVSLAIHALSLSLSQSRIIFAFTGNVGQFLYSVAHDFPEVIELSLFSPETRIHDVKASLAQRFPAWFQYDPSSRRLSYFNLTLSAYVGARSDIEIVITRSNGSIPLINNVNGLPVIPFSFLLLHELMLWDTTPQGRRYAALVHLDNIDRMLHMLRRRPDIVHDRSFDEAMHMASVERVARYFVSHRIFRKEWQRLGLLDHRRRGRGNQTEEVPIVGNVLPSQVVGDEGDDIPRPAELVDVDALLTSLEKFALGDEPSIPDAVPPPIKSVDVCQIPPLPSTNDDDSPPPLETVEDSDDVPPPVHVSVFELPTPLQSTSRPSTESPQGPSSNSPQAVASSDSKLPPNKKKKPKPSLSRMQMRRIAARTTFEILQRHELPCAFFGSMACRLYGNDRIPNDIDVLVLPPPNYLYNEEPLTQESIKALLVAAAPSNYLLRPAKDPEATYQVLYFLPTPRAKPTSQESCKVDVLLPGVMSLPALKPSAVWWRSNYINLDPGTSTPASSSSSSNPTTVPTPSSSNSLSNPNSPSPSLPVLPFAVLLLQKLQAWDDHLISTEERYKKKVPFDVKDLEWMLDVGVPRYINTNTNTNNNIHVNRRGNNAPRNWKVAMMWRDRALFDEEFELKSRERVRKFCASYPMWKGTWRGLGFEVP